MWSILDSVVEAVGFVTRGFAAWLFGCGIVCGLIVGPWIVLEEALDWCRRKPERAGAILDFIKKHLLKCPPQASRWGRWAWEKYLEELAKEEAAERSPGAPEPSLFDDATKTQRSPEGLS
jgi:hypothetical protein